MPRQVLSRRALSVAAAVAGVVGAVGGVVVAGSSGSGSQDDRVSGSDPLAGAVLWADRDALHDGDVTVPLRLVDSPLSLRRTADGWLVTEAAGYQTQTTLPSDRTSAQVSVVRPDGTKDFLAEIVGVGDVSPDGTRYLAASGEGYVVWDLTTLEPTDTVRTGRRASQESTGRAQWVDDDTVATGWSNADGNRPEVLVSDLGSSERRVLADDLSGPWTVSPDGRWLVSRAVVVRGGQPLGGCTMVRATDPSTDPSTGPATGRATPDVTDCGGEVDDVASFAPDSSVVLTVPDGRAVTSDRLRPLPLGGDAGDRADAPTISVPSGSPQAVALDRARIALVVPPYDGATTIEVCSQGASCAEVGRTRYGPGNVVLGS